MSGGALAPASFRWTRGSANFRNDMDFVRGGALYGWVGPHFGGGWIARFTALVEAENMEFPTKQEAMAYVETVCRLEAA